MTTTTPSPARTAARDRDDPLGPCRARFHLPAGLLYFDGNSLGPRPHGVSERVAQVLGTEWGEHLIGGWNDDGWITLPQRTGATIARLIGAPPEAVLVADARSLRTRRSLVSHLHALLMASTILYKNHTLTVHRRSWETDRRA